MIAMPSHIRPAISGQRRRLDGVTLVLDGDDAIESRRCEAGSADRDVLDSSVVGTAGVIVDKSSGSRVVLAVIAAGKDHRLPNPIDAEDRSMLAVSSEPMSAAF